MLLAKNAIVTGAAQGIGAAIAIKLAQQGCNVAVCMRNQSSYEKGGKEVVEQCRSFGVDADVFLADVSSYAQCEDMVKAIASRFGTIDILVNNAGITRDNLLPRMSEQQFDEVISSNLKSTFNMMKLVSAYMIKQRGGRIINMSSVVGQYGNGGQTNYAASKAGIIGMTLSAAKELGARSITVNAIAPGFIQTSMTEVLNDKQKEAMLSAISLKRYGTPEDVAELAAFLASDKAGYITGQVIAVDGGMAI
ncbi:MAG TPA: 3-oxoacyl-[acyl-carrier-protein] reductase [Ruminococcaceae bacterium]|nr:3-oxoacyl-[acyl-carrier-protein] reductase [Oscillospiraceae bacterium]